MEYKYKLNKRSGRGPESPVAKFVEQKHVEGFVKNVLLPDKAFYPGMVFVLYDRTEEVQVFDLNNLSGGISSSSQGGSSQSGGGSRSSVGTPFSTRPTPPGIPKGPYTDEDDKSK